MVISRMTRPGKRFVFLLLLISYQWLTACSVVDTGETAEVVKSDNDHRAYRYLELPNQLRVLLISDPDSDKAAASLDVNVGSGADPEAYPGLAHFLEHMLFLGTEKYPQAGEYQSFVSAHGGDHNAYTSFEHTNYFFDLDPRYLDEALDRFAQFFIAPLFTAEYVDREKNAVHSEFMAKIKDDQRKSLDVFKTVVNPRHPFSKFSVGNLETLDDTGKAVPLRQALIRFHKTHYSANIMTLVVLGKESLDELEQLVSPKFSAIPDYGISPQVIAEPLFEQGEHGLPLLVQIRPEKKQRTLTILFPTEDVLPLYRDKPLQYIGNILGHEGRGSLFSWLKAKGWAEALSAGTGLSYRGGATFNISIQLTKEGVDHPDEIVAAVFRAIKRIQETPHQAWLYKEQRLLAEQSFRYQEIANPIHHVMSLASGMHYYAPQDSLRGPYIMGHYERTMIERFLADLQPQNSLVTLSAPDAEVDLQSVYYQTPYSIRPIDQKRLQSWATAQADDDIRFPEPNPFVAQNLHLKTSTFNSQELAIYNADKPTLVEQEEGYRLWYKPDQRFTVPRASLLVKVKSPLIADDPQQHALLALFTQLIADQLNELSYPALLAGLSYDIYPDDRGFVISISGFDEKQGLLLDEILAAIAKASFDPNRFENIRRELVRNLENKPKEKPYLRVFDRLAETLHPQKSSPEELLGVLRTASMQQLESFHTRLMSGTDLDILVHGNYRLAEARKLGRNMRAVLLQHPQASAEEIVVKMERGAYSLSVDSAYSDAALLLYLQAPDLDKKTRALMGITAQILRPDFYTTLRTEKQLGYIVTSGAYPIREVPGLFFLVQSPVAGPETLQREISTYLQSMEQTVESLSAAQFDREREALILRIMEKPKNLAEQSRKYWMEIDQHYYNFDFEEQLVAALESLTVDEWRQFYRENLLGAKRALWIFARGQFKNQTVTGDRSAADVHTLQGMLGVYRFP